MLTLGALMVLLGWGATPAGAKPSRALRSLREHLRRDMSQLGGSSGAYVLDLTRDTPLFAWAPRTGRLPASIQKLYTTTTVLLRMGPTTRLSTSVLGSGWLGRHGVWHGTLYLRGGGDPSFGSSGFDRTMYGGHGATVQRLVSHLLRRSGIRALHGSIRGDAGYFDALRSTSESNYQPDIYMEGELSALAFDRGYANSSGTAYQVHPVRHAAREFAGALRAAGVNLPQGTPIRTGTPPSGAQQLAVVHSPPMQTLIRLTNTPSDNFFAEMLLKGLGARFGSGGSTAAGATVVRSELATVFGLHPRFDDGSGLSRSDSTSPHQVVTLLRDMKSNPAFRRSLAIGGETGTLQFEMQGTPAQGNCRGKTGSLTDVANLAGYCRARDGHLLAFAFLANGVSNPDYVHSVEANQMAAALARYSG